MDLRVFMSDKSKPLTLAERLNSTGNKLAELSKKVSESTKTAVGNANDSIKNAISENKQKRDAKKQKKLEEARTELSAEGLLNDVPSMVTLPGFEQERISIVSEQNDNLDTAEYSGLKCPICNEHLGCSHHVASVNRNAGECEDGIWLDEENKFVSLRFSFSIYNTFEEVDYVISQLKELLVNN